MLKKISFLARFTAIGYDGQEYERFLPTDFNLGLGPCGKVAIELETAISPCGRLFQVIQTCEGNEAKRFTYKMSDIRGRIVEEIKE